MARTFLCTVGTSLAKDCPSLEAVHNAGSPWDMDAPSLADEVERRLSGIRLNDLTAPTELSKEVNSLLLLGCGADDEVILLAADDAIGRCCAERLARIIPAIFGMPDSLCKVTRIRGLHMRDAARFRKEGLPNLIQELLRMLRDPQRRYERPVVLNPTGGFKGVVPFITVLGMLYGARVAYVSRASHQLVTLPPLPLTYDPVIFERAREALEWAERKATFKAESFLGRIPGYTPEEYDLFAGFLETDEEEESTLSPLALVLIEKDREGSGQALLAPAAMAKLDQLKGTDRDRALTFLRRSGNPKWRAGNPHGFETTALSVFGNKSLGIRIAGFVSGTDFYVCEFFFVKEHGNYVSALHNTRRDQYPDLDAFLPLPKGEFETDEIDESWSALLAERDALKDQIPDLLRQRDEAGRRVNEASAKEEELRQQMVSLRRAHQSELAKLQREIAALRSAQDSADKPDA
jgi:putative CRISPR-associated protein (TIGR02619 family)